MENLPGKPGFWLQYGKIGYYRAQKMQPLNGYFYHGEARLLSEAVRRGGKDFYPEAKARYERAIALYPAVSQFRSDYARLLELGGEAEAAVAQYRAAEALGGPAGEDRIGKSEVGSAKSEKS